MCNFNEVMPH